MTILDEILAHKRREVADAKTRCGARDLAREARACTLPLRGFRSALLAMQGIAVIAEVKRRSPSKGLIRPDFDPVEIARAYAKGGAACISVLTDSHYFGGSLESLAKIRVAVDQPLLCKDFMIDTYQIDAARVAGADAILLIVAALDFDRLKDLQSCAVGLGLDVLVEVHDESELDRALAIGADLIGVNNRNLKTFEVDLANTERLASRLSSSAEVVLVAESGIATFEDVKRLERAGARGFLVGESLMRQPDPGKALEALCQKKKGIPS
jgi:indole-3-glycerol phosphate synthase